MEVRYNPCILRGPRCQARRENYKWLPHPCLPRGPKRGRDCYITCAFWRIPSTKHGEKIRSGYLTPAFLGAQKGAALQRNTCIPGGPQDQARGENQKWLPHPAFLGAQKGAGLRRNPCILGVPNAKHEEKFRSGYLTPAFLGVGEGGINGRFR